MALLFFKAALAAYLISTLGYVVSLLVRKVHIAKLSAWMLLVAFVLHAISLVSKFLDSGHLSVTGIHDTLSLFAWLLCGIYLVLQLRTKTRVLGAFISPAAFLLTIAASVSLGGTVPLPDALKGGLVTAHVLLSVAGEALFALASCAGAMYLIQDRLIKRKLVHTTADPDDGRRVIVQLTEAGRAYTRELMPKAETVTKVTLAPLATSQRTTLISLLKQLR